MIWVLYQSESPWQPKCVITFFIYLCVSLSMYVPAVIASILWERFGKLRYFEKKFYESQKHWVK